MKAKHILCIENYLNARCPLVVNANFCNHVFSRSLVLFNHSGIVFYNLISGNVSFMQQNRKKREKSCAALSAIYIICIWLSNQWNSFLSQYMFAYI